MGRVQLHNLEGLERLSGETPQLNSEDEEESDRRSVLKWFLGHFFALPKECCFYLVIIDKSDLYH